METDGESRAERGTAAQVVPTLRPLASLSASPPSYAGHPAGLCRVSRNSSDGQRRGGQHAGHRLERHHLLGRGVGIEIDRQGLDQRRPVRAGPARRARDAGRRCRRFSSRTRTAPSSQQAVPASSSSIGSLRSRLSPCGVIAPNRSLPRSLRRWMTAPQRKRGQPVLVPVQHLRSCSRNASTTSGDCMVGHQRKRLPHTPRGGGVGPIFCRMRARPSGVPAPGAGPGTRPHSARGRRAQFRAGRSDHP